MVSKPKKRQRMGRSKVADSDRPQMGRPKVADADRRETLVRVLTTATEHEELQRAAADASMSVSTWVRSVALERARANAAEKAKAEK